MPTPVTLVRFNVQNAKYATQSSGTYGSPVSFGTSKKIALERDADEKKIYGDGYVIVTIPNDRGKTGTLTVNNVPDAYEVAMGRKLALGAGYADIKQRLVAEHAIYFETCGAADNGSLPVAKTWLFGVTSKAPSENFDQNTDDINETSFDIPLTIKGTHVKNAAGTADAVDANGNAIIAYSMTLYPGDTGYDNFGNSVPTPKTST